MSMRFAQPRQNCCLQPSALILPAGKEQTSTLPNAITGRQDLDLRLRDSDHPTAHRLTRSLEAVVKPSRVPVEQGARQRENAANAVWTS